MQALPKVLAPFTHRELLAEVRKLPQHEQLHLAMAILEGVAYNGEAPKRSGDYQAALGKCADGVRDMLAHFH